MEALYTPEQAKKLNEISALGYKWDKQLTISYAAVVFKKDEDLYVFGLDGTITYNPKIAAVITIKS